jgi:hypothetical protein
MLLALALNGWGTCKGFLTSKHVSPEVAAMVICRGTGAFFNLLAFLLAGCGILWVLLLDYFGFFWLDYC